MATPNKYSKWYAAIIRRGGLESDYKEKHHILPKSFNVGGEKDPANLVELSAREHFITHCCLARMFTGPLRAKMLHALKRMNSFRSDQHRYTSNRAYEYAKREYAAIKKTYVYRGDSKRMVYNGHGLDALIVDGWSTTMLESYKAGRVGQMKGKKHSDETKAKQSLAQTGRYHRPWTKEEREHRRQMNTGRVANDEENARKSERLKRDYEEGTKQRPAGSNNPMFGRKRKAAYNPETRECRYVDITNSSSELDALLESGWKLGLLRKSN